MTQLPMVHTNGTSGQALASEYANALRALDDAIETLNSVTVHGRDYYPIGDRAFCDAQLEHSSDDKKPPRRGQDDE